MRIIICLMWMIVPMSAADKAEYPQPKPTKRDEAIAKTWSPLQAAAYLDGVGINWTRDRKCITCHTNLPYIMARPHLKTGNDEGWKEVRQFLEDDVAKWNAGGKSKGDTFVVATATALALNDANTTGKLHPLTRDALDRMWTVQKKSGEWNWIKCDWPPLEHDDYYGAVLAAVAVGHAPEKYAESEKAAAGIAKLKTYLIKTHAPDLHHKAMLLWASQKLEGVMQVKEQAATIAAIRKLQRGDGGWNLPSFGNYTRHDESLNDTKAESDGYGTGYAVYVLRQAGVKTDDPSIVAGVKWLKANQRDSGRWFTRSLSNDKAHYITNAGSAFAVLALAACEELSPTNK